MDLKEIAHAFVAARRKGRLNGSYDTLFAEDAYSMLAPMEGGTVRGQSAIRLRASERQEALGGRPLFVDGPYMLPCGDAGDRFAVMMERDMVEHSDGPGGRQSEIAVYTVKDGRIVSEEVFLATDVAEEQKKAAE